MNKLSLITGTIGLALGLAACNAESISESDEDTAEVSSEMIKVTARVASAPVCPGSAVAGTARCHAQMVMASSAQPLVTPSYSKGLTPSDIQSAYSLPPSPAGAGVTVAVVAAYDYPTAEQDLAVYRAQFGLPPCTTANGCFKKVNQAGKPHSYPLPKSNWALEMALDLAMVSATCPSCDILLVEATTNSFLNLGAAVSTAVKLGALAVSNSYGGIEYSGEASNELLYFNHPGIAITASSGDSGFGVQYPAASRFVTAVGGTRLTKTSSGWVENTWTSAGSGCSAYIPKPAWQQDAGCVNRTVADVSAVADPASGVAVYNSYPYLGQQGWWVLGGTSAAAPIIAGVYALAGNAVDAGSQSYDHPELLRDVTLGTNGSCADSYLCAAGAGYDGPTGNGTPNGIAAF